MGLYYSRIDTASSRRLSYSRFTESSSVASILGFQVRASGTQGLLLSPFHVRSIPHPQVCALTPLHLVVLSQALNLALGIREEYAVFAGHS